MIRDLVYFGREGKELQEEFIASIKCKFPEVILEGCQDEIKGLRQGVVLEEEEIEYYSWMVSDGWIDASLNLQVMQMSEMERIKEILIIAKIKYPDSFKEKE